MAQGIQFAAQCPACGNRAFEQPEGFDLEVELDCPLCGFRGKLMQFADAATIKEIEQLAKETGIKALRDLPGLKPGD